MNGQTLKQRIESAYVSFRTRDMNLLELGIGERTIAGRLAHYLIELFPEHDVDIEYNKHGVDPKRVHWPGDCRERDRPLVVPDIVIHRRGHDRNNLLVIEVKRSDASAFDLRCDREKLGTIKSQYHYQSALLLVVPTAESPRSEPTYDWLANGD